MKPLAHALLLCATVGFILLAAHGNSFAHFIGCAIAATVCFFAARGIQAS